MITGESAARAENLTIRYGGKTACENVTFEVRHGSVYALLGRNGAGKSSLIRCLLGLQKPDSGAAFLFGRNVWKERCRSLQRVGVVPEEPDAPPEMKVRQIAAFCSRLYPAWDQKALDARLERFGISKAGVFGNLSKGQKSMLQFALALAPGPDLVLMDDPTLGLDVVARKSIFEDLVCDLADRAPTVLITTHDLPGVEGIADRIGILRAGRLLLDMELDALKSCYRRLRYQRTGAGAQPGRHPELELFAAENIREDCMGIEAVVSDFDDGRFARFCSQDQVLNPEASSMSLEEIMIAVTSEMNGRPA
jgi:ABC-2 type transport system ATP-binding protein